MAFVELKDWDERTGQGRTRAAAIANRATGHAVGACATRSIFALTPPADPGARPVRGLRLRAAGPRRHRPRRRSRRRAISCSALAAQGPAARRRAAAATCRRRRSSRSTSISAKAAALGLSLDDINDTLTAAWGGAYVNDFIDRGRVKRVFMQGDAPYRMQPEDLGALVRARRDRRDDAVLGVRVDALDVRLAESLERYNGLAVVRHPGRGARRA